MMNSDKRLIAGTIANLFNTGLLNYLEGKKDTIAFESGLITSFAVTCDPLETKKELRDLCVNNVFGKNISVFEEFLTKKLNNTISMRVDSIKTDFKDLTVLMELNNELKGEIDLFKKRVLHDITFTDEYDITQTETIDGVDNFGLFHYLDSTGLIYTNEKINIKMEYGEFYEYGDNLELSGAFEQYDKYFKDCEFTYLLTVSKNKVTNIIVLNKSKYYKIY